MCMKYREQANPRRQKADLWLLEPEGQGMRRDSSVGRGYPFSVTKTF